MPTVAIIGAGMSGLAAAHRLRDAGYIVTLFEKNPDAGGRATTERREGFIYDHGAQYIKKGAPASVELITERFSTPDLIDISKPIWIFDGKGRIQEGDSLQNAEPKWNYRSGLVKLAELMAAGLDIRFATSIHHVQSTSAGWVLFSAANQPLGTFERLLITLPAPEASELMRASQLNSELAATIDAVLATARYNPLLSVMHGYRPTPIARPYYALVNTDKAHAISWLAWEHEKSPERAAAGTGLLIAQMAPQYSQDHWETSDAEIADDVAQGVARLIDEPLPVPFFTAIRRWRYALPATKADADVLNAATLPLGLAFCGDAFVGGRVHLALEHGMMVAQQLING
jgi:predicted NAD/FAD-dependent oxidoreductase